MIDSLDIPITVRASQVTSIGETNSNREEHWGLLSKPQRVSANPSGWRARLKLVEMRNRATVCLRAKKSRTIHRERILKRQLPSSFAHLALIHSLWAFALC